MGPPRGYDGWADHWHGPWAQQPQDSARARRFRLIFPVIVSLIVQVPTVFLMWNAGRLVQSDTPRGILLAQLTIGAGGALALLAARRFPGPVVAVVSILAAVDLFVGVSQTGPPYIALAFAIVSAVARGARVWAWISVATAWVAGVTIASIGGFDWPPFRIATTTLGILIVFGVAESVRTRRERHEQITRVMTERRQSEVQAERVRIARELHDVLAHSLSQINVQAGVGLHLMDAHPEKAKEALASIKETSKSALDEVRSVLGVLRADGGAGEEAPRVPEPDLSRIPALAASAREQGIDVSVTGLPGDVPPAIGLALYRIVQESLTNVARHARAAHVVISFSVDSDFYRVSVTDDGSGSPHDGGGGRGLLGMRERAELLGGTMQAGPRTDAQGFRVEARIPGRTGRSAQ
jgi:signal transduction histidine kinase